MAINFARCVFVQRSRGHSILVAAAYIARAKLAPPYPAVDYSDRQDLLFPLETVLPSGTPSWLQDPFALWHAIEIASPRKDSTLGLHLILALPAPGEMPAPQALPLVREFIEALVLPHGLGAAFAIHDSHHDDEPGRMQWLEQPGTSPTLPDRGQLSTRNRHAHVLVSPRRVGPDGVSARRYTALDPPQVSFNSEIRGVAMGGIDWPTLWSRHQNDFFARHGLALRVRPRAGYVDYHHGSKEPADPGRQEDADPTGAAQEELGLVERANRSVAGDPSKLLDTVGDRPFTRRDLTALVDRYVGVGHAYDATIADTALAQEPVVVLGDAHRAKGSPWLATHDLALTEQRCIVLCAALMDRPASSETEFTQQSERGTTSRRGSLTMMNTAPLAPGSGLPPPSTSSLPEGTRVFSIDHGRGRLDTCARYCTAYSLDKKLTPGGHVLIDYADSLTARNFERVLGTLLSIPDCRLVLSRRPADALTPRNPLLDIVAHAMASSLPGARPVGDPVPGGPKNDPLDRAISRLDKEHKIIFGDRAHLLAEAKSVVAERRVINRPVSIICPDNEFAAWMRMNKLPAGRKLDSKNAILVHTAPSFGDLTVLPLLAGARDAILLVDHTYCPDLSTLRAQAEIASNVSCAIGLPAAADARQKGAKGTFPIRWAVDRDNQRGSSADHVAASLKDTLQQLQREGTLPADLTPGPSLTALLNRDITDGGSEAHNEAEGDWHTLPEASEELHHQIEDDKDDDPNPGAETWDFPDADFVDEALSEDGLDWAVGDDGANPERGDQ